MDQASRIVAGWTGVISHERTACAAWNKAVGKKIAPHAHAVKMVRRTLVVEVEDEIWQKHLWGLRHQILRNLEKVIGPEIVSEMEFRVMPPRVGPGRETAERLVLASQDEAESIQDPGLRRIYKAARRREIA